MMNRIRISLLLFVALSVAIATTTYILGMKNAKMEYVNDAVSQSAKKTTNPALDFYSYDLPYNFRKSVVAWVENNYNLSNKDYTLTIRSNSFTKEYDNDGYEEISFLLNITGAYTTTNKIVGTSVTEDGNISSLYVFCTDEAVRQPCKQMEEM